MEARLAIVDDDISIRKMLRRIIEEAGLGSVVMECADGIQAEKSLRDHCPSASWEKGELVNGSKAAAWAKRVLNS